MTLARLRQSDQSWLIFVLFHHLLGSFFSHFQAERANTRRIDDPPVGLQLCAQRNGAAGGVPRFLFSASSQDENRTSLMVRVSVCPSLARIGTQERQVKCPKATHIFVCLLFYLMVFYFGHIVAGELVHKGDKEQGLNAEKKEQNNLSQSPRFGALWFANNGRQSGTDLAEEQVCTFFFFFRFSRFINRRRTLRRDLFRLSNSPLLLHNFPFWQIFRGLWKVFS